MGRYLALADQVTFAGSESATAHRGPAARGAKGFASGQPYDKNDINDQSLTVAGDRPAAIDANRLNAATAAVAARDEAENRDRQPNALAALPAEWRDALARIETRARPDLIPAERWTQAVADAGYLVRDWGLALFRCGWTLADLFSAHQSKPLARFDAMGLCLLLQGRKVGPIDADRIAIRQPRGAALHFRQPHLLLAETAMLWDLP